MHPFTYLSQRQDVRECCRNVLNLDVRQTGHESLKATCRVCGRGHIKMGVRGGHFQSVVRGLGEMETTPSGLLVPK